MRVLHWVVIVLVSSGWLHILGEWVECWGFDLFGEGEVGMSSPCAGFGCGFLAGDVVSVG